MCLINVVDRGANRRHVFIAERPCLVQKRGKLLARCFPLFCADANVKPAIPSAIRAAFTFDIERHDSPPAVKCNPIDEGNEWRLNFFAADFHQLFLHTLSIIDAFNTHLVVDTENDYSTTRVREGYNFLGNLFCIREFYFELKKGVFTAAYQSQQFDS